MFCTQCGRPSDPSHKYCAECGHPRAAVRDALAAPISPQRFDGAPAGSAALAALCVIIAVSTTYAFVGTDGHAVTLHDSGRGLAYNVVFVATLLIGAVLTCFARRGWV